MPATTVQNYLEGVDLYSQSNARYQWLLGYLRQDPDFRDRIHPVAPGRTRIIVADFFASNDTPPLITRPHDSEELAKTLATRPASVVVRLITVVGISDVDQRILKQCMHIQSKASYRRCYDVFLSREGVDPDRLAPLVTRARTAGEPGTHPIKDHTSCLPQPEPLSCVAAATGLDAGILLRHLDQREHLVYKPQSQSQQRRSPNTAQDQATWFDISLGVNQANYVTAVLLSESMGNSRRQKHRMHHTVCLLANEDNCLGIDFNDYASPLDQVLQSSDRAPHKAFEERLQSKDEAERDMVLEDPLSLIWDYAGGLSSAFACQLELYRRKWEIQYEKYAKNSAVYGNAASREHVRKEATELGIHLQYMRRSIQSLKQVTEKQMNSFEIHESGLGGLIHDFEYMSTQLEGLKLAYDNFNERHINTTSLAEARESMTEARDLQRLSYLGFVFAPLSLASSFFSINIRPLGGEAPVWAFVITSLGILSLSVLTLLLWNPKIRHSLKRASERAKSFMLMTFAQDMDHGLPKFEDPETTAGNPQLKVSSKIGTDTSLHKIAEPNLQQGISSDGQTDQHFKASNDMTIKQTPRPQSSRPGTLPQTSTASQGRPHHIPKNDSERYQERLEQLKWTAPHDPPLREEFPDKPKASASYSITQHRSRRKKSDVLVTVKEELSTFQEDDEDAFYVSQAWQSNTIANLAASTEEPKISISAQIQTNTSLPARAMSQDSRITFVAAQGEKKPEIHLDSSNKTVDGEQELQLTKHKTLSSNSDTASDNNGRDEERVSEDDRVNEDAEAEEYSSARSSSDRALARTSSDNNSAEYQRPHFWAIDSAVTYVQHHLKQYHTFNYDIKWSPDPRDIMIARAVRNLCIDRDLRELLILVETTIKSNHNFDALYAWCLAEAARWSFLQALPILYNVIEHPQARLDGLDRALQNAIGDSDEQLATMRWLQRRGAPINIPREAQDNLLTIASKGGHEKAVQLLLSWGADPNLESRGFTEHISPLEEAAAAGHLGIVNMLLGAGAVAATPNAVGNAASSGHLDILKVLVAAGGQVFGPESYGSFGDPLCLAAAGGHLEVVNYILELGAPLDESLVYDGLRGHHALSEAAQSDGPSSEAICLMLLDLGVKPKFTIPDSDRAQSIADQSYLFAALSGKTRFLSRILETGADANAIAIMFGYIDEIMAKAGNSMDREDLYGNNMLGIACGAGRLEAATLLLQFGANANFASSRSGERTTPLHIAANNGRVEVAELLISHGADIHARKSPGGAMPVHLAARSGFSACLKYLLGRGAGLEAYDDEGQTPLIIAAREGKLDAVETLLDEGASVSARDKDGWTAAHRAAWNGHERILRLLVERGADPEAVTNSGLTIEELLRHAEEEAGLAGLQEFM